jgi:hypothetical protein
MMLVYAFLGGVLTTQDGRSPEYWKTHWVVIAQLAEITVAERPGSHEVTLDIKATITGEWDVALSPRRRQMRVRNNQGGLGTAILELPPVDSFAAVLIEKRPNGQLRIPTAGITFSPSKCAIVPLSGLDDPKLDKLIENIAKLRSEVPNNGAK